MYKSFYAGNGHLALSLAALAFFVVFFLAVVVWIAALKRPADFTAVASLPLDDGSSSPGAPHER